MSDSRNFGGSHGEWEHSAHQWQLHQHTDEYILHRCMLHTGVLSPVGFIVLGIMIRIRSSYGRALGLLLHGGGTRADTAVWHC